MRALPPPAPTRRLFLRVFALLCLTSLVCAQGGYRTHNHKRHGLNKLPHPNSYWQVPTPPTEDWIFLKFSGEDAHNAKNRKRITPEIHFVNIPWVEDPKPEVPAPEPEPTPNEEERSKSKPAKEEKEEPPPPPINSLERYLKQEMSGWYLGEPEAQKPKDGYERTIYPAYPPKGKEGRRFGARLGWVWEWKNAERTIALLGFCHEDDLSDEAKIWKYMATKVRLSAPEEIDVSKWVRFYENRPKFKDPDFRIKIRSNLTKEWKADDTENYIILYSTKNKKLIQSLKQELEAIRKEYEKRFPPAQPVTAVSAVRVCRDKDEYHRYGGPLGSGGYWYDKAEELVFFDYDDKKGERGSGKKDSKIVLYHEAFHQYIYYSAGKMAPHSWFNEGTGDYFSGAKFASSGKISKIGVNPWRIDYVKWAIQEDRTIPWDEIIEFEQSEFYRRDIRGICYAQAWSMIYFLRHSKEVARREDWSSILPKYFKTLKATYDREEEMLAKSKQLDDEEQVSEAKKRAREKAVAIAFEGISLREIEEAWREYTLELKSPK